MNISPAIIIDVALIAVIVVSVFHYARKGFVAGLMDLVGNLASLALAWVVSVSYTHLTLPTNREV